MKKKVERPNLSGMVISYDQYGNIVINPEHYDRVTYDEFGRAIINISRIDERKAEILFKKTGELEIEFLANINKTLFDGKPVISSLVDAQSGTKGRTIPTNSLVIAKDNVSIITQILDHLREQDLAVTNLPAQDRLGKFNEQIFLQSFRVFLLLDEYLNFKGQENQHLKSFTQKAIAELNGGTIERRGKGAIVRTKGSDEDREGLKEFGQFQKARLDLEKAMKGGLTTSHDFAVFAKAISLVLERGIVLYEKVAKGVPEADRGFFENRIKYFGVLKNLFDRSAVLSEKISDMVAEQHKDDLEVDEVRTQIQKYQEMQADGYIEQYQRMMQISLLNNRKPIAAAEEVQEVVDKKEATPPTAIEKAEAELSSLANIQSVTGRVGFAELEDRIKTIENLRSAIGRELKLEERIGLVKGLILLAGAASINLADHSQLKIVDDAVSSLLKPKKGQVLEFDDKQNLAINIATAELINAKCARIHWQLSSKQYRLVKWQEFPNKPPELWSTDITPQQMRERGQLLVAYGKAMESLKSNISAINASTASPENPELLSFNLDLYQRTQVAFDAMVKYHQKEDADKIIAEEIFKAKPLVRGKDPLKGQNKRAATRVFHGTDVGYDGLEKISSECQGEIVKLASSSKLRPSAQSISHQQIFSMSGQQHHAALDPNQSWQSAVRDTDLVELTLSTSASAGLLATFPRGGTYPVKSELDNNGGQKYYIEMSQRDNPGNIIRREIIITELNKKAEVQMPKPQNVHAASQGGGSGDFNS